MKTLHRITRQLKHLSLDELSDLNRSVINAIKQMRAIEAAKNAIKFLPGDRVRLDIPREKGQVYYIEAIKRTNAVIRHADTGKRYNANLAIIKDLDQ